MTKGSNMEANNLDAIVNSVNTLIDKYKDHDYMRQRINIHILNSLPTTLEYEFKNYEKRVDRTTLLATEQQTFIQVFLQRNLFYYLPNINVFYEYNGRNYLIVREDDIIHKLLSTISKDRILLDWKQKTKLTILKQIKERSLFTSLPESDTIQHVLNTLYPCFFSRRNEAKYFLTILGDNVFKKNSHLIYLVSTKMKKLMNEVDSIASLTIGQNNVTSNFMAKYHENHSYENCRLIKMNDTLSLELWSDILKKVGLDLMCVAVHYSNRYGHSDVFIEHNADDEVKTYATFIKHKTSGDIADLFCSKYIEEDTNLSVEWKNIHFVWKQFLSDNHFPNMIYYTNLKALMRNKYAYNESTDTFHGITSKFIPSQKEFILFWETHVSTMTPSMSDELFDTELEIDEIFVLFKLWSKDRKISSLNIHEECTLNIIKHYFSNIQIVEDKYLLNVYTALWDKNQDIINSFSHINHMLQNYDLDLISFDEIYNLYYEYCTKSNRKLVVSKRYFEKFLHYKFSYNVVHEQFIDVKCLLL